MIWIFDLSAGSGNLQSFSLYGVTFFSVDFLLCVRDMLIGRFDTKFLTLLRLCEMLMPSFLSAPSSVCLVFPGYFPLWVATSGQYLCDVSAGAD